MVDAKIDEGRRRFLVASTCAVGGVGALCALKPFLSSWLPNAATQASGAPVEVDLSALLPGQLMTVEWRGKPVWILHRTPAMLEQLQSSHAPLRDPDSLVEQQPLYAKNMFRSIKPEYLILVGLCTHLGCIPQYKSQGGESGTASGCFLCPCHGSTFDLAGRVFQGMPAPVNLEVPPYRFVQKHVVMIGEDQ